MNRSDMQTFYPATPGLGLNTEEYGFGDDCGNKPLDPSIDPTLWNGLCVWNCSKEKNKGKPCCVQHSNQAARRATRREAIKLYYVCKNAPTDYGSTPDGTTPPPPPPPPPTDAENKEKWASLTSAAYAGLSCDDMTKTYGITSKSTGTANDAVIGEFENRCGGQSRQRGSPGSSADEQKANNKKWIIIGIIAVVAIIGIAIAVRMMRSKAK
jgi:hypothetical protein